MDPRLGANFCFKTEVADALLSASGEGARISVAGATFADSFPLTGDEATESISVAATADNCILDSLNTDTAGTFARLELETDLRALITGAGDDKVPRRTLLVRAVMSGENLL